MSEFDSISNDNEVECPYCEHKYQPEATDHDETERVEECENCGRQYFLHQSFSVTHHTQPDCVLNGGTHDYQPLSLGGGKTHPFCTVCGKCQPHHELSTGP